MPHKRDMGRWSKRPCSPDGFLKETTDFERRHTRMLPAAITIRARKRSQRQMQLNRRERGGGPGGDVELEGCDQDSSSNRMPSVLGATIVGTVIAAQCCSPRGVEGGRVGGS